MGSAHAAGSTVGEKVENNTITINWLAADIRKCSDNKRRQIGSLWQELRLIEELTVGQNINCGALGKRSLGWAIANLFGLIEHRECLKCLNAVGLSENIINMNIEKLSSGQKKRIAIEN